MKYFISHASEDAFTADLALAIEKMDKNITADDIFFSSNAEQGSDTTKSLFDNLDTNLEEAEQIVLVITEAYLRKPYCIYELNVISFFSRNRREKTITIIVQNQDVLDKIAKLFPGTLVINASDSAAHQTLIHSLSKHIEYDENLHAESNELLIKFFDNMRGRELPVGLPFFGMSPSDYNSMFMFPEAYHIDKMVLGVPVSADEFKAKTQGAREIIMLSTTGASFLKIHKQSLINAVKNGASLSVIYGLAETDFIKDVADIEVFDSPNFIENAENNFKRINDETKACMQYLNEIYASSGNEAGQIARLDCFTLFRQTAVLVDYGNGNVWGWITCIMPPARSSDSPSFVFRGNIEKDVFANSVYKYCNTMKRLSEARNHKTIIDGSTVSFEKESDFISLDNVVNEAKEYWEEKRIKAEKEMQEWDSLYDCTLIEVAAQHPLRKLKYPGKEFEKRLDKAVEIYHSEIASGRDVKIYVPGSRHCYKGVNDEVSLGTAGREYLIGKGIPEGDIFADDMSLKYKGPDGVYNSADECFVASEIFKNNGFDKLICVCSVNQIMRKAFLYLEFGIIPECHAVTADKMFHADVVKEMFGSLMKVVFEDHSWQNPEGEMFINTRKERIPKD